MSQFILTLRRQAIKAMTSLQGEIVRREKEIEALKMEAARWTSVLGGEAQVATASPAPRPARAAEKPRLDWNAILAKLPATFKAKDVANKAGKPIGQVYTYLSRWMKDKKVRKGKDGYQKISPVRPSRSQEKQN